MSLVQVYHGESSMVMKPSLVLGLIGKIIPENKEIANDIHLYNALKRPYLICCKRKECLCNIYSMNSFLGSYSN